VPPQVEAEKNGLNENEKQKISISRLGSAAKGGIISSVLK